MPGFWIIMSATLLLGVAIFNLLSGDLPRLLAWLIRPFVPKVRPRIGYKRARVVDSGFAGVGVDYIYGVASKAHGLGFHAYEKLEDALNHAQAGDVFLEVLLSGTIREHNKGYIASRQRVLQVISDRCLYCRSNGTHFVKELDHPFFLCGFHAAVAKPGLLGGFTRTILDPIPKHKDVKPLSEFASTYGWLKDTDVVVTSQSSRTGFVPTKLPEASS